MARLYPTLKNGYKTPDKKSSASCTLIALNIAGKLLDENKEPYILMIEGELIDSINRKTITPKIENFTGTWGAHMICCEKNLAYDPMISPEPTNLERYLQTAFEEKVCSEVSISKREIKDVVEKLRITTQTHQ